MNNYGYAQHGECVLCCADTTRKDKQGRFECFGCADAQKVTYPVRMPAPCTVWNCFDGALPGAAKCAYHLKTCTYCNDGVPHKDCI